MNLSAQRNVSHQLLAQQMMQSFFLLPHHGEGNHPSHEGGRLWVQSSCADAKPGSSHCRFGAFALKIRRYLIFVELPMALKHVCRTNFCIFLQNPLY